VNACVETDWMTALTVYDAQFALYESMDAAYDDV
jgi:hypothetical protein